ncbi:hypothetical protein H696_06371 [Fonticula alba]|uniref:Ribosome assembly factor mrt4 n=1 Tax=Fonticula alba TaxID=691883 RepID=A0A058YYY9_FONAL|nr:hypothetical protein H696_06371 [Fonticula alba]KCV67209.1 hypothetical protein H696_06371 [Fonticula alba]|eukprot:XP_009498386.1 hypothetical protein H696_06371 [Fonticula alba]
MARSRRAKLVSLTNTTKRGREQKENLITEIQEAIERFNNIYLFSVEHMRNTFLKDIRADLPDSRFFFGKNRVMSKAFGVALSDEPHPGLAEIGRRLVGNVGLLLTNRPHDEIVECVPPWCRHFPPGDV